VLHEGSVFLNVTLKTFFSGLGFKILYLYHTFSFGERRYSTYGFSVPLGLSFDLSWTSNPLATELVPSMYSIVISSVFLSPFSAPAQ